MEFDNLIGSKYSTPSTKFVGFGPIGKQMGHPGLLLAGKNTTCVKFLGFMTIHQQRWLKVERYRALWASCSCISRDL